MTKENMTTSDKLYKSFLESNKKTNEALFGIREALNNINDQNKLHCDILTKNTDKLVEMVAGNKSLIKLFQWIIIVLVSALIVIAGAEEALKIIPKL